MRNLNLIGFVKKFVFNHNLNHRSGVRQLYVQGQSPSPNIREYFYYIDHQGMVCIVHTNPKPVN